MSDEQEAEIGRKVISWMVGYFGSLPEMPSLEVATIWLKREKLHHGMNYEPSAAYRLSELVRRARVDGALGVQDLEKPDGSTDD